MLQNRNTIGSQMPDSLKRSRMNPFSWIESGMKQRKSRKEKKLLQMKMAMLSGGITRMK
jgi:hypothetical protein